MTRLIVVSVAVLLTGCNKPKEPAVAPAGAEASAKTDVLKAGAAMIQGEGPLNGFNVYLVGFHPMKQEPAHQMEAHHFCKQVNEDFAQCVLFDGNTSAANMTGVEYIISEKSSRPCRLASGSTGTPTTARSSAASSSRPVFPAWRRRS